MSSTANTNLILTLGASNVPRQGSGKAADPASGLFATTLSSQMQARQPLSAAASPQMPRAEMASPRPEAARPAVAAKPADQSPATAEPVRPEQAETPEAVAADAPPAATSSPPARQAQKAGTTPEDKTGSEYDATGLGKLFALATDVTDTNLPTTAVATAETAATDDNSPAARLATVLRVVKPAMEDPAQLAAAEEEARLATQQLLALFAAHSTPSSPSATGDVGSTDGSVAAGEDIAAVAVDPAELAVAGMLPIAPSAAGVPALPNNVELDGMQQGKLLVSDALTKAVSAQMQQSADASMRTDEAVAALAQAAEVSASREAVDSAALTPVQLAAVAPTTDVATMQASTAVAQQPIQLVTRPIESKSGGGEVSKSMFAVHVPVSAEGWDRAVGQKVVMMVSNQRQEVEMQLNPPHLGPLEVKLTMNQGEANLSFISAHSQVREALQASMPRLTGMMAENGIQLMSADVSAGTSQQRQDQQRDAAAAWSGSRRSPISSSEGEDVAAVSLGRRSAWLGAAPGGLNLFV